ncbi:Helicase protein with RING/U-box domain [Striga hermonthica]|uniref:Helicase protein with RING/U-box domain n=1 Tax=Striga hermonthica TaxID=68872 RepID=A0A9N7MNV6_STRHE|nr:Helicase protein with RING/U-box domain [Striga hermonthica]
MELRSRTPGSSSSKGKAKLQYTDTESSDEDDYGSMSSDSDYNATVDGGEGLSNVLEDSSDFTSETSDDELQHVSKRRKRKMNTSKSGEGPSHNVQANYERNANTVEIGSRGMKEKKRAGRRNKKTKTDKPVLMWEVQEEEMKRWVDENLLLDTDLTNQNEIVTETAKPSDDLIIPLLKYQQEWLAWALKQEESNVRGGILADEMGMGKTLQAIALVLLKRSISRELGRQQLSPATSPSSSKELPAIKGTLVICPLVAVMQWVSEIDKCTSKGSAKVLVYHGANRAKNHYEFADYDFVITTYSIVEGEYRKYVMPPKEKCHFCGKLFYENKLKIHLKYMCGPFAVRTEKQAKQQRKSPKTKKPADSERSKKKGKKHDSIEKEMENDYAEEVMDAGKTILHFVRWERIILDEAHYIKDRRSNTTKAVLNLQSCYKWALSGTPLQNHVGELYSLVRFLQIVPYSYYFCKDCDCRQLDYSSRHCPCCGHRNFWHFCWWNRYISSPMKESGNNGRGREAILLLKHKILKSSVLRRTKKGRASDLALPNKIVTLRRDTLDVVEEDYYTALYNESQAQFNTYVEAGTVLNNYAHIFDLLTRLRQAVDHPYLVEYSLSAMERKGKAVESSNGQICGLCHDPEEDTVVALCGHAFCRPCLIDFGTSMGQNSCPSCSKPLTVDFTSNKESKEHSSETTVKGFRRSSILNRIQLHEFQTSTKIEALKEEITVMIERDGSAKGIVFSQFSSFLDLIRYSLQKNGVNCVQLDGSMSMGARDSATKRFTEDPDCKIFLMSMKAGGVALNLTAASHVFLMDPCWNPAVERQAQDRIYRIGQHKPIQIVRFIIENSVEERILKIQEKKELMFEGTVGGSSEALAKLTADSDFADVLLSFLALPLGTIVQVLKKHYGDHQVPVLGSLTTLYNCLHNLDSGLFQTHFYKNLLLYLKNSSQSAYREKISVDDMNPSYYFKCRDAVDCIRGVFIRPVSLIITDDLQILPNYMDSAVQNSGITDMIGIEVRNLTLGFNEIMDLLKGSLLSRAPLMELILENREKLDRLYCA